MGGSDDLGKFLFCDHWPWCMRWLSPASHTSLTHSESMLPPLAMPSMPSLSLFRPPSPSPAISTLNPSKGMSLIRSLQLLNWAFHYTYMLISLNRWVFHSWMFSDVFTTAIFVSFLTLCVSVCMLGTFVGFPKLFGLSGPRLGLQPVVHISICYLLVSTPCS